jgi:hypothetical protein
MILPWRHADSVRVTPLVIIWLVVLFLEQDREEIFSSRLNFLTLGLPFPPFLVFGSLRLSLFLVIGNFGFPAFSINEYFLRLQLFRSARRLPTLSSYVNTENQNTKTDNQESERRGDGAAIDYEVLVAIVVSRENHSSVEVRPKILGVK